MAIGESALGKDALGEETSPFASTPATGFCWPMMWENTGTPSSHVDTDAGAVVGGLEPDVNATVNWSDNPALILADFSSNTNYGARKQVDWTYAAQAADFCDSPVSDQAQVNCALNTNGGSPTASSTNGANVPSNANNGDRTGATFWQDNTSGVFPDWLEIDFSGQYVIDHVIVYSVQDAGAVDPSDELTFTLYGLTDFYVQGWDAANNEWRGLGQVTGNNLAKKRIDFTAFTTNKIRIVVNDTADHTWAKVAEVEVFGWPEAVTEKRNIMTLTLDQKKPVRDWMEAIRAYVPAWIDYVGQKICIIADQPKSTVDIAFTKSKIAADPEPTVMKRGAQDIPNVVQIVYTNTDVTPWASYPAEASVSSAVRKIARIDMPGIRRFSQAKRFATEMLNHYRLEDQEGQITVFEDGLKVMLGDHITITHDVLGAAPLNARVMRKEDQGHGRWVIQWREYDVNAYNDGKVLSPAGVENGLPDPRTVEPITDLLAVEQYYKESDLPDVLGGVATGHIYQSRLSVTWTASTHAYPVKYIVRLTDDSGVVVDEKLINGTTQYVSPPIQQQKTFTVEVITENSIGARSDSVKVVVQVYGNQAAPGDVPAILTAFEVGGETILTWEGAASIDTIRYEWQYGPADGSFVWLSDGIGNGVVIDRVDGLYASFKGIPVGTWLFAVKAINSAGKYSANPKTVQVTVTTDANAFLQSWRFAPDSVSGLVNLVPYPVAAQFPNRPRWVTSFPGTTFNQLAGGVNPLNTAGAYPLVQNEPPGTATWTGQAIDLGSTVSGDWSLTFPVTVIEGAVNFYFETASSLSGPWTRQSGLAFKGSTRCIRPVAESTGAAAWRVDDYPTITLAAVTSTLSDFATTGAAYLNGANTTGVLIALSKQFTSAVDLQLTAYSASVAGSQPSPYTIVADRIMLYPQSGLMMQWTVSGQSGTSDAYGLQTIWAVGRTIQASDFLEYEVWIDPACPAAADLAGGGLKNIGVVVVHDSTAANYPVLVDTISGANIRSGAGLDVRGEWCARKISLAALAGHVVDKVIIGGDADANGTYKVVYRNMRFTNGAADVLAVWPPLLGGSIQSETSANVAFGASLCSGTVQVGPANTFIGYAYVTNTGVLTSGVKFRWVFKGY